MKRILLVGVILMGLVACSNQPQNQQPIQSSTNVIDGGKVKIERVFQYKETPEGISIITTPDGNRFIYCETSHGVAITQIMENGQTSFNHTETTPIDTTIY